MVYAYKYFFLNQAQASHRPMRARFLKIVSVQTSVSTCVFMCVCVCLCVCVCVYVSTPEAINN